MPAPPDPLPPGAVAVIFTSRRSVADPAGYAAAAAEMDAEAARQPGYLGIVSARDAQGAGITVSYWANEADAIAWRAHPGHAAIRARGRDVWYDGWRVDVAHVTRSYGSGG